MKKKENQIKQGEGVTSFEKIVCSHCGNEITMELTLTYGKETLGKFDLKDF